MTVDTMRTLNFEDERLRFIFFFFRCTLSSLGQVPTSFFSSIIYLQPHMYER